MPLPSSAPLKRTDNISWSILRLIFLLQLLSKMEISLPLVLILENCIYCISKDLNSGSLKLKKMN